MSTKSSKQEHFDIIDRFSSLFSKLDCDYITALPPGTETDSYQPGLAFSFIRILFSVFLLIELLFQLLGDWGKYARNLYANGLNFTLNISLMLLMQTFALTGIWGPKFTHLLIFFCLRFFMALDLLSSNSLYCGLVHCTAAVFSAAYLAMCWNAIVEEDDLSDMCTLLVRVKAPTQTYEPFSRLSYNLIRFNLVFLLLASLCLDIESAIRIFSSDNLGSMIINGLSKDGMVLFGLYSVIFGHFYRLLIFTWFYFFGNLGVFFDFNLEALLSFATSLHSIILLYMIWKIAKKPFLLAGGDEHK